MGRVHFLLLSSLGIPSLCPFQRGRKREERLRLCSRWPMGLLLGWGIEGGQGRRWQGEADLLPTSQSASWGQNTLSLTLSTRHPAPHKGCQGHRSTLSARAGLGGWSSLPERESASVWLQSLPGPEPNTKSHSPSVGQNFPWSLTQGCPTEERRHRQLEGKKRGIFSLGSMGSYKLKRKLRQTVK